MVCSMSESPLIARRRKSDMISALDAALQSPEVPPEARERMETFLRLYRSASRAFMTPRSDRPSRSDSPA